MNKSKKTIFVSNGAEIPNGADDILPRNLVKLKLLVVRAGLWVATVLGTAQVGGPLQAAGGFVVNNGSPQTGVVVGQGYGNETVTGSGLFTGSFKQNPGNIYCSENININPGASILCPGIQPFVTNNVSTFTANGQTYTNASFHQAIVSFIHGTFTNNGVLNYTNNALTSSTALYPFDSFPAANPPQPNTNLYYYFGEGVFVDVGNVQYGGPATIVNGSPANTNAAISSVITGSGVEIAQGVHAEAYYSNLPRTPAITFLNYGPVAGCSTGCVSGAALAFAGNTLYGGITASNGPFATATALAPYYTTALYAFSYYGDVNISQAGQATAISTGGLAGNAAGYGTAVGMDAYSYNGQINLYNSGTITASATSTGTCNANAVFAWAENDDTNVTGGFTFVNSGTITATATRGPGCTNATASPLYGGCDGGIVNLVNTGTVIGNAPNGGWAWGTENDRAQNIYIYNSGTISHNTGLGVFVYGQPGGQAIITNTTSGSIYGGNEGIATENFSGNVTIYDYGSVMGGSQNNNAMDLGSGNDTVHLYGLPNIVGWMNGQGGTNVLDFELTGVLQQVNGNTATLGNNLAAYNLGASGSIVVSGQTYKWANFNVSGTITSTGGVGSVIKAATNTDLTAGVSWIGGIPPIAGNIAGWTNTSLGAGLTMNSPISWGGMRVVGAASDIAISGSGPLTLGTNGVDMSVSPVNLLLSVPVILGTNQTWNINGGENLSVSGIVSGNYGLSKAGAGMLVLTNANTFSGGTTVNGGTLALDYNVGDTTTGTLAGGSTVTVNSGGTLRLDVEDVLGYYGGAPAQLNINGGLVTSANVASGSSFRVTLPALTFTGGTLSSGTNMFGDQYGGSYLIQSTVNTLASSSTAVINAHSVSLQNTTFTVAAGSTPSGVDLSVSSILGNWQGGGQSLTKAGNGVMTLSGANTYSGGTSVNGGTLNLANVNAPGAAGTWLNFNATANLELSTDTGFGGTNPVYNVGLGAIGPYAGTMILNRATPGAGTPITHNFGALTLSLNYGAPTALNVLAGPNAPTGGAVDTLAFSSLNFGNWYGVTETIAPTNANVVIAGPAVAVASQASSTQVATLALDGTSPGNQITGGISDNPSGTAANKAAILKSNSGKWTLSGTNTYTGNTTINAGTLALRGNGSMANTPSIAIAGGATFDVSGLSSQFVLGNSQTLGNSSATALFAGNGSAGNGTLALNYGSGTPSMTVTNGTLTVTTGTIFQINNLGGQLVVGSYTLISKSTGGAVGGTVTTNPVPVGGGGAAASAKLALVNGELNLVVGNPVNTNPTNLTVKLSGNTLNLSWPADHLGWTLQTNSVGLAATNQWFAYPGSAAMTNVNIRINSTKTNVFFRMIYP